MNRKEGSLGEGESVLARLAEQRCFVVAFWEEELLDLATRLVERVEDVRLEVLLEVRLIRRFFGREAMMGIVFGAVSSRWADERIYCCD
jgi:hypothetical protein